MHEKINVILVDDHKSLREGYTAALKEDYPHIKVTGEAANGMELLNLLAIGVKADVVLLDIEMPVMDGMDVLNLLNKDYPALKVIMVSTHDGQGFIVESMKRGARSFLSKTASIDEIAEAVEKVHKNNFYLGSRESALMVKSVYDERSSEYVLTEREKEILRMLCEGKTNKEIGQGLKLALRTIEAHRASIYKKTNSKNNFDLFQYAYRLGIYKKKE